MADWVPAPYPGDWVALKLLEGDVEITAMMRDEYLPAERWDQVHEILMAHEDAVLAVASGRYDWVGRMIRAAVTRPRVGQITLTERLDRWATHPLWGLAILASILGVVFWLTFAIGTPLQKLLETYVVGTLADISFRLAGGCARLAQRSGGGWYHRWGWDRDHLSAHPCHLFCRSGSVGGYGLHGPRCLRDGPLHAPDGACMARASCPSSWVLAATYRQ